MQERIGILRGSDETGAVVPQAMRCEYEMAEADWLAGYADFYRYKAASSRLLYALGIMMGVGAVAFVWRREWLLTVVLFFLSVWCVWRGTPEQLARRAVNARKKRGETLTLPCEFSVDRQCIRLITPESTTDVSPAYYTEVVEAEDTVLVLYRGGRMALLLPRRLFGPQELLEDGPIQWMEALLERYRDEAQQPRAEAPAARLPLPGGAAPLWALEWKLEPQELPKLLRGVGAALGPGQRVLVWGMAVLCSWQCAVFWGSDWVYAAFMAAMAVLFWCFALAGLPVFSVQANRSMLENSWETAQMCRPQRLVVGEAYLLLTGDGHINRIPLRRVIEARAKGGYVYLRYGLAVVPIPARAFESPQQRERFVVDLNKRAAAARKG